VAARSRTSQMARNTATPAKTTFSASIFFDNEAYPLGAPDAVPPAVGAGVLGRR
jgi:hypothetical protein